MNKAELKQLHQKVATQRTDLVAIKDIHEKWVAELQSKTSKYREDSKRLGDACIDKDAMLQQLQARVTVQTAKLEASEERVSLLEMRTTTAEAKALTVDDLTHQVQQLSSQLLLWERDSATHEEGKKEVETLATLAREKDHVIRSLQLEDEKSRLLLECVVFMRIGQCVFTYTRWSDLTRPRFGCSRQSWHLPRRPFRRSGP